MTEHHGAETPAMQRKAKQSVGRTHGLRFYMIVSFLPLLLIFICACIYIHTELNRISNNAEVIVEQVIPSIDKTQQEIRFFSELGYVVNNMVANSDIRESRVSYLRARELIKSHLYLLSVRPELDKISANLDWMMTMRNKLDIARSRMFGSWQTTYLYVVDMHAKWDLPFDSSAITFLNHDVMHHFHSGDLAIFRRIQRNVQPFISFCDTEGARTEKERCLLLKESFAELEENYTKAGRLSRDLFSLNKSTIDLIRSSAAGFATTEYDILYSDLTDLKETAGFFQLIVTVLMLVAIGMILVQNAVVQYFVIRPLTYLTGIIHAFMVHRKVPERFYSSNIREIKEIESLLPSVFSEVRRATQLNLELLKTNQNLKDMSLIDDLTGVRNRRALNDFIRANSNTRAAYSVLMIDIDYFKALNDTQGHLEGDKVLKSVAQTIVSNTSRNDHVFRYGGEEFCVVLGAISAMDAIKVGERLRRAVEELRIPNQGAGMGRVITVSVGVSSGKVQDEKDAQSMTAFIAEADVALYRAKNGGRNRTCHYDGEQGSGHVGDFSSLS